MSILLDTLKKAALERQKNTLGSELNAIAETMIAKTMEEVADSLETAETQINDQKDLDIDLDLTLDEENAPTLSIESRVKPETEVDPEIIDSDINQVRSQLTPLKETIQLEQEDLQDEENAILDELQMIDQVEKTLEISKKQLDTGEDDLDQFLTAKKTSGIPELTPLELEVDQEIEALETYNDTTLDEIINNKLEIEVTDDEQAENTPTPVDPDPVEKDNPEAETKPMEEAHEPTIENTYPEDNLDNYLDPTETDYSVDNQEIHPLEADPSALESRVEDKVEPQPTPAVAEDKDEETPHLDNDNPTNTDVANNESSEEATEGNNNSEKTPANQVSSTTRNFTDLKQSTEDQQVRTRLLLVTAYVATFITGTLIAAGCYYYGIYLPNQGYADFSSIESPDVYTEQAETFEAEILASGPEISSGFSGDINEDSNVKLSAEADTTSNANEVTTSEVTSTDSSLISNNSDISPQKEKTSELSPTALESRQPEHKIAKPRIAAASVGTNVPAKVTNTQPKKVATTTQRTAKKTVAEKPLVTNTQVASFEEPTPKQPSKIMALQKSGKNTLAKKLNSGFDAYQLGHLVLAKKEYDAALAIAPENRDAQLGRAAIAIAEKDYISALKFYQQRLARDPYDNYALTGILSISSLEQPSAELIGRVNVLLDTHPNAPHLHFLKGSIEAANSQWRAAYQSFSKAREHHPHKIEYIYNLAIALDHLNRTQEALDLYRRTLNLANQSTDLTIDTRAIINRIKTLVNIDEQTKTLR